MKILLTNDDGIQAEGIQNLRRRLEEIAQVTVVAPSYERSATGHGITVHKPIRAEKVKLQGSQGVHWSVVGTPADCVKLALETLWIIPRIWWYPGLITEVIWEQMSCTQVPCLQPLRR